MKSSTAVFLYAGGPQVSIDAGWSEVQIPFKAGYEAWFERGFIRLIQIKRPPWPFMTYPTGYTNSQPASCRAMPISMKSNIFWIVSKTIKTRWNARPKLARDSLVLLARERAVIDSEEKK